MIPLTFLYDEYIDRPKLTEQKKAFEYTVPPPTSGVGTIKCVVISNYYISAEKNVKFDSRTLFA